MAEISKSLESRVSEFAARTGQEIKKVRGEIATSNTAAEALTQRVAANEGAITALQGEVAKKVEIDDAQASATKTYSSQKVEAKITAAKQAVKNDLLGGAGEAYVPDSSVHGSSDHCWHAGWLDCHVVDRRQVDRICRARSSQAQWIDLGVHCRRHGHRAASECVYVLDRNRRKGRYGSGWQGWLEWPKRRSGYTRA